MSHQSKLALDAGWSLVRILIVIAVAFGLNIIISNTYGPEILGIYNLTMGLYISIASISALGIGGAIVKYTAEYHDNKKMLGQLLSSGLFIIIISGTITAFCLIISNQKIAAGFQEQRMAAVMPLMAIALTIFMLNKVLLSLLNGLRSMRLYALCEAVRSITLLVLICSAVWQDMGLTGIFSALIISEFILLCMLTIITRKMVDMLWDLAKIKQLLKFGVQTVIADAIATLNSHAPALLIGIFLSSSEVGVFSTAMLYILSLMILPGAVQQVTTPAISEYHKHRPLDHLAHLVQRAMMYSMILLVFSGLSLGIFIKYAVPFLYAGNEAFLEIIPIVQIAIPAALIRGVQTSVGGIFSSVGKPHISILLSGITLLALVSSNLFLVPQLGLTGAALSLVSTYVISFAVFSILIHRIIKIKINLHLMGVVFFLLMISYSAGIFLPDHFSNPVFGIGIAFSFFIISIMMTGIITKEELKQIMGNFR